MANDEKIDSVEITTGRAWELLQHKNAHGKIPMSKQLDFAKIVHFQVNDGGDVIILLDNGKVYEKIYCGNGVFYKWQELNWLYELKEELHADETIGNA